jgi:hypothetical protein
MYFLACWVSIRFIDLVSFVHPSVLVGVDSGVT